MRNLLIYLFAAIILIVGFSHLNASQVPLETDNVITNKTNSNNTFRRKKKLARKLAKFESKASLDRETGLKYAEQSFIFGIISLVSLLLFFPLSIILGIIARKKGIAAQKIMNENPEAYTFAERQRAKTGVILGTMGIWLTVLLSILFGLVLILFLAGL